jgi:hypothetical protein
MDKVIKFIQKRNNVLQQYQQKEMN